MTDTLDLPTRKAITLGWVLLAISMPLGLTLEALHALKVGVYLGSELRRELWTLAHAHGNLLGILCLVFGGLGERCVPDEAARARVSRALRAVSFSPSRVRPTATDTIGGRALTPLKKEKGARFRTPSGDSVETQAIGRGTISCVMSAWTSRGPSSPGWAPGWSLSTRSPTPG